VNITTDLMNKTEEKICELLPEKLRLAVEERDECAKIAQEIRDVYFDGKPFDSSELSYLNVSSVIKLRNIMQTTHGGRLQCNQFLKHFSLCSVSCVVTY